LPLQSIEEMIERTRVEEETLDRFHCLLGFEQSEFVMACAKLIKAAEDIVEMDTQPLLVKEKMEARRNLVAALDECKKSDAYPHTWALDKALLEAEQRDGS
jgi:hypothetical protein